MLKLSYTYFSKFCNILCIPNINDKVMS
ncbi:unnamed protein product [Acanthoscelides obtectus]|uniref:Uncharacterized protein n=1 Tax=Acanthoscelides obtectus TaxID=200917 RepID=A0A9P0M988_ACAOB|nr:unnamed protein product [Acanthoscelides obtectus]CAK1630752.1 hypothetical protein AOBTE_LOCUS6533 [Acanthoscelides obtectus]